MTSVHPSKQMVLIADAEVQTQHSSETISIRNLFNDRHLYEDWPEFQRGFVWPDRFKRALVDSILRGDPIHPLLAFKSIGEDGKERFRIIDGHQRLSTIYAFMEGKFATWTHGQARTQEPSSKPPVEPGRRFNELSDRAKNVFLAYKFVINTVENVDEDAIGRIFRRVQHQYRLQSSEKLASYSSKALGHGLKLQEHS